MEDLDLSIEDVYEIFPKVWLIQDNLLNIFLIEGTEKALLIDTGWGIGNLSNLISSITSLPLIVVNTHGHLDHISGNFEFNEAYINERDIEMAKLIFTEDYRRDFINIFSKKGFPKYFLSTNWVNVKFNNFIPLNNIKHFDLGNRIVDIIDTPGHTPGSICLFDHKEGLLFSGDTVSEGNVLVNLLESLSLNTFFNSLNNLSVYEDKLNYILPYHGNYKLNPEILRQHKNVVEKIILGEIKGTQRDSVLGKGMYLKSNNFTIAYTENNI